MRDDGQTASATDDRISRARERMSMDYEDTPVRPEKDQPGLITRFLGSDSGTRRLAYGAAGLGGLLVLGIGGWALLGHRQQGIPVMGPPSVPVRTRPVDPGGMQLDAPGMGDEAEGQHTQPVPAPEKPDPAALAAKYGANTPAPGTAAAPSAAPATPGTPDGAAPAAVPPPATGATPTPGAAPSPNAPAAPAAEEDANAPGAEEEGDSAAAAAPTSQPASPVAEEAAKPAAPAAARPAPAALPRSARSDATASAVPAAKGGRYQVQLAALQSAEDANKEWSHLKAHYATLFGDKTPAIIRTERNNATFYRLRVTGFASVADARTFCGEVRERGMACMVARQ